MDRATLEKVRADALALTDQQRAELARDLIASLDAPRTLMPLRPGTRRSRAGSPRSTPGLPNSSTAPSFGAVWKSAFATADAPIAFAHQSRRPGYWRGRNR